jgi:hypothetical protein
MDSSHKFCTKCGHLNSPAENKRPAMQQSAVISNDKWWQRLVKVVYIFLYAQILWIVPVVWSVNSTDYDYYGGQYHYTDTTGEALWYSTLAIIIFIVVIRLIKFTVLYIAMGRKPEWKKEFKKLF